MTDAVTSYLTEEKQVSPEIGGRRNEGHHVTQETGDKQPHASKPGSIPPAGRMDTKLSGLHVVCAFSGRVRPAFDVHGGDGRLPL